MTALVTKHLPLVAGAPDGIKKLRALILDLAVRGRLVQQDSKETSAADLLSKTAQVREQRNRGKRVSKVALLDTVALSEDSFPLPEGWARASLSFLALKLTDGSHNPPRDAGSGIPMLSSQNVLDGHVDFMRPSRFISREDFEVENARTDIAPGDVLLTIVASIGRSAVVPDDAPKFVLQRSVAVIQTLLAPRFLSILLRSPLSLAYFNKHAKGTAQKGIYLGKLGEYVVCVPPLAEQHRIVAKVDELMALCDRLEADQADAEAAHAQLVQALLDSLIQATDAADFRASWQRLSEHFHTLFTTEASIDALKQTVLQLAVMGKLVKQNPEDEWASELLKRVALERTRLLEEGGSRKQKSSAKFADEDRPFDLPLGWAWVRLGDYCLTQTGTTPNKSQHDLFGSHVPFIKPGDIYTSWVKYDGEGLSALGVSQSGRIARAGSLLMVCIGTIGKCNLIDRGCSFNQQINSATLYEGLPKYLLIALRSRYFQDQAWGNSSSTTIAILNKGKWESIPIPLPGITEQHRIVAKVDELMALCDQLKGYLAESRQQHAQLATVLVEQAVA